MGLMIQLRRQIREMFEENRRKRLDAEQNAQLERKLQELKLEEQEAEEKKQKQRQERGEQPKQDQESDKEAPKYILVESIGSAEGPAKIDPELKTTIPAGLMEHIEDDTFQMYPASVCRYQGKYAIWPLANIVMGLAPNYKVEQIGADRRDFTRKNLKVIGQCEPETFSTQQEMRSRYLERCKKSGKKFEH
jgi:hypothetical protein